MKILSFISMVMFMSLLTSYKKSSDSPIDSGINPFSNGGSERNMIVVLSDKAKIIPFINNGIKSIYANSGTWIDDKSGVGGAAMNFVVITPQSSDVSSKTYVKLYNFEAEVVNKMAEDSLRY